MNAKEAKQRSIENHDDTNYNRAMSAIIEGANRGFFSVRIPDHLSEYDQDRLKLMGYKIELKYTSIYKEPYHSSVMV